MSEGVGGKNRDSKNETEGRDEEREKEGWWEKGIQIGQKERHREGEIERLAHRLAEIISH